MLKRIGLTFAILQLVHMSALNAGLLHSLVSPNEQEDGMFGQTGSGAGDVNGDGYDDVIIGAYTEHPGPSPLGAGRAYVFDGQSGMILVELASPNEEYLGYFGNAVSAAGDVNNDGYDDVIVGAPQEDVLPWAPLAGRAYVFSGDDGSVLYSLVSPNEQYIGNFGTSVSAAGDVNDDGYDDVLVGAYREDADSALAGRAYLFSGLTGDTLTGFHSRNQQEGGCFGRSVSRAGDIDNDGDDDIIVGAMHEDSPNGVHWAGMAYVFDGETGQLLHQLVSPDPQDLGYFGCSVSGTGDVNGDGCEDVIVGAMHEYGDTSPEFAGRAHIYSGETGSLIRTLISPNEGDLGYFGWSVSDAGDVNDDGCPDVVVGARCEYPGSSPTLAGRAYIFCGQTGDLLYTLMSPNEESGGRFGCSVSGAGDVDSNGCPDVVVGAMFEDTEAFSDAGRAYVFSPASSIILGVDLLSGELLLGWTVCCKCSDYWVYGTENQAYFEPGFAPSYEHLLQQFGADVFDWSSAAGISNPDQEWTYLIVAVDTLEQELCRSNPAGEREILFDIP